MLLLLLLLHLLNFKRNCISLKHFTQSPFRYPQFHFSIWTASQPWLQLRVTGSYQTARQWQTLTYRMIRLIELLILTKKLSSYPKDNIVYPSEICSSTCWYTHSLAETDSSLAEPAELEPTYAGSLVVPLLPPLAVTACWVTVTISHLPPSLLPPAQLPISPPSPTLLLFP